MWKLFSFLKMFREDLLVMMATVKDSRTHPNGSRTTACTRTTRARSSTQSSCTMR